MGLLLFFILLFLLLIVLFSMGIIILIKGLQTKNKMTTRKGVMFILFNQIHHRFIFILNG
jgi:hypothetical protein